MAEETNGMGFLDYKGDDKTNVPMKPQEPEVVKSVPSPKPASIEKPTTVSQVNEKLTKEALAAPTPTTKSVKEKALVGGPLKTPIVGEVERKERTWDYDFGDNKTGKNPYEAKKSTEADEFGMRSPSIKEVLSPDYKPLDQESFNNLAEWIVKRQGVNFDNLYSDPAKYAKYVDESVRRAKTKEGYYLTDQHRKDLADRALTIASQYNYQRKVLPDAIKKSGVAQKMLDRGYNPSQDTDKEISGLISKGEKKAKEQGQILFDQVKSKYQKEIDQIKSDADSVFKEAQSRQQELLNTMVQPLYNSKVAEIQSMLDQNKISFEEAKAYVDGDGEGPSPMQVEIGNKVMQSPEFKKQASDISSQYLKPINDRLYQINQTIKSEFDKAWGPQGEKINSEIKKEAALIQSKSGMTKEEGDILMKAIGGVMDDHDNIEYARSYAIRAMSYGPGGSAVVGKSFLKGISSVTDDMIASMFNTFSDTYVNKMDVEISKKQFENNWINTSSLIEKEGWTGGINPASVATYVGQQVPIMAMTAGVGLATGAASAIAAEAIGATVNASRLIGATAGGVADWIASTELNNEGVRKQAIAQGLSPEQADKTVYENTKNMSLLMPLYMLQMGTLLSPSLKITQKFGFEMGLETVQEHLENMASNVAVAKGEGSYGKIDPITGEKMGLSYQTMKYLYDPEFKETTLATLFSTAILGGAMSNIGSNVNSKLEKAAMFKMFQGDGHISSKAALDMALDMGKITEEQHVEGTRKIEALRRSIESSHKMDLGDTNLTIAAAYKMYDIANNEAAMAVETNEATKSVLKEKIDTANKELKDIASGKSPVYVLYTANSGPVVLTKEDIASKADDHEFVKALHDKTQALEVINDPATKSKINESIKSYAEARAKNVEKMSSTAEENRMTKEEALELVDLQTKEEQLAKTGQELTDIEKQRMSVLSSKGTINLAAIERGAKRKESLEGTTRDFANRVRKSLSKSFKNTTIVDSSENLDEFVNGIVSELKAAKGTENVSFDKQSGNFVIGQPDGQTEVIPFENIKGLRIGDKVYYNSFSATKDTMVHEVAAHGWINEALKATTIQGMEGDVTMDDILNADDNSLNETGKLLKQGLNLMKDSDYHQELYGNSFYSSNSLGSILEEALAQAIGEHGAKFQESKIQQLKQWIMKFIPFLRQNKGKFIEGAPSADMSIKDYLDGVVSDVFGDSELGTALSEERAMSDAINDRFENNETAFEDDGTPLKRNFSVSGSDIVEPKKSKYKEVKVSRLGHNLSFVKKSDVIDIVSLIKQIRSEKKKVWFWVADQLGRGYYYDEVIDGMHYLDAGPSYALDPVNRKNGIIWATGLEEQTILNNIANSDYIFIISGSPERSKMFNQQVYDLFIKRAGDYAEFKKNILATSGISMLNKIVSKYNSWEELRSDRIEVKKNKKGKPVYEPVRKVFLSIINDQKSKQRTALKKMLVEKNLFIDFDSLRDGFYRDNGFDINDIMLVLKPESIAGKSKHSTYETDLSGSVVGVPDKIINAYDIISDEYKKKNKGILQRVNQSQVIAPFGSGIRSIGRKFQVHTQDGFAAKPAGKVFTTPHYNASIMVADYVRAKGLPPVKQAIVKALDVNLSSAIADYYDTVQNDPNNPEVIAAYQQMADETRDQFDHMISNGYSIEIYNGEGEPYKVAADMIKDLNENKHLYILSTKKEYGQGEYDQNDSLLKPSGRYDINGEELLNNDLFRAVHDFYGHAVMGNGFGPVGEENAWLIHSQMYSDKARGVMTTETRMQNSWVNFNRSLRTVSITQEEAEKNATRRTTEFIKSLPKEIKDLLLYQWSAKQNPKWHPEGNTLKHAIIVLRRAHMMFPNDNNMILAALFHDLGKVDTYAISEKTGQPTAYGHEKKSVEYIDKFSDWVSSVPGVSVDEVKYLVQNHMKIKPAVWNQMGDAKKELIEKHDAFQKLVKFTDKLDKGGIEIGSIAQIISEDAMLKDVDTTAAALDRVDRSRIEKEVLLIESGSKDVSVRGVKFSDIFIGDTLLDDLISNLTEKDKNQVKEIFSRGVDYFEFNDSEQKVFEDKFTNPEDFQEVFDMLSTSGLGRASAYQEYNDRNYINVKDNIRYILQNKNEYSSEVVSIVEKINKKLENPKDSMQRLYAVDIESNLGFSKSPKQISEAYHKAKEDGSNPELVNAVEKVLGVGRRTAKVGEEGYVPLKERRFAEQKKTIAPDWIVSSDSYISQQPIVGDNHVAKFSVKDKDFPKDKNVNAIVNSRIYGQLTEDGEGNFVFFHASPNAKLDKLGVDPAKFGYNLRTSGEERRRSVPVSMYYTRADVSDVIYKSKYFVKIPKNKVYFFNADPLGLKEKAMAAFMKNNKKTGYDLAYNANEQIGYMMLEAKKLGYKMIIAKWGNGLLRAETVDKIYPTKLLDLEGNVIKPVTRVNFLSNAQKKRGYRVPKDNRLASERDYKWYDAHVDDLFASELTKDEFVSKMQTGKFVILTPENPNNQDYFEYENDNLVSDFEDEMTRMEINFTPVIGKYGRYERSFIIFDTEKSKAKSLCKKFMQESVAADFGIYYLEGDKFNPRLFSEDKFMDGQMDDGDDFMSTIMTTDGPVSFSLGYDFSKDKPFKSKFQIIGIEGAKKVKSMRGGFVNANKMEMENYAPKYIFAATGWFRDFAGNWAYEIDNGDIKNMPNENPMLLSDVLDYDEVFKMYPDAGDFKVIMKELPDQSTAQVNLSTKEITLNANTFAGGKNEELLKQSLMHELQHVIQMKEGFDMGSSLESSIGVLEWVRGAITKFNDAIAENRVKISDTNFERYMNRIKVDVKSVEAISEIMKQEQRQEVIPYFFDYGEMVARYSEGIVKSKSDKTPMFSILPTEHLFALSSKRIINIHDAFIKGTGKISHGPGKKLNIPTFGWQVDGENIRKAIQNERLARGTTMKAAANYFSGVTETPEEKEARLQLRDQIMLEIMAAKDAYEQAQVEAALAREYEGKKRDIEEAFRLQEAEERITKRLNRKIRYEQVVSAFRLLGERQEFEAKIATWEGTKSMIITIIEDYRKRGAFLGKINARTLSTFSKMILNANTDKRLNTALAYLDKALEDKRYDELVAAIRSRKDMIASMIKNDKNPFGNMYDSVVELISYDESKLFDANAINNFEGMEVYLNMLDSIANKNMPDFKAYTSEYYIIKDMMERAIDNDITDAVFDEIKTYDQMNAAIDNITSMEINSAEDFIVFRKLAYTLNRKVEDLFMNGFISQEQYDETTIALSRKSRSEKIEQPEIRQKVEEFEAMEFDAAKRMINNIDTSTLSGFNLKYFNKLKLMVNKPSALSDFRKIGTDGIILLSKIADQLGVGFVSPKMFKIISDVNVQVSADTMAADVSNAVAESLKPGFMKRRIPDDVMKIISKIQGLPKQVVDQALSLGKSKTYYNNIVYELNKAFTNIRIKNKELGSMMNTKMRKYLVGPSWFSSMPKIERYRVGLLMKQLDYQSNIVDFEAGDRPKDVTRHLLSDDFQRALLSNPKEYAAIKKAYESFPKKENGDIDVEGAIKKLSGREKALFDAIRSLFDEHLHPMMQETNARRGELVENQNNYYRRYSQGIKQSSFDEDMTPASIVSNMETYRIRSGSTKSRISDGLYWTVVDPEAVVFRAINEMSTDYYLSEAVPNAMSTLKYANSRVEGKSKYIITALQQLTRNTLVTELTVNRDAYTFDIFSYANKTARNLLLSSPTRFFTEMIPSLAKGFISRANTDNFEVAFEKFKKKEGHLYKKLYYDMSLPFKDNIGQYSFEGGASGRESVLAASADAVSTMSDALFSKFVFKTEFETEFFRVVGQEFDIKKYNEDAVYAQNLLDSGVMDQVAKVAMYNTERIAGPLSQFSVPTKMLWVDRTSKIAKILGFMQSYNAFEQKMFINNIRDAISGENEGRLDAARMSAGIIAGGMSYAMIGYFINQLYKEMGGDDEEDMSEEVKQAWQSTVDKQSAMNMFIKSCINTLTGAYGQLSSIGANFLAGIIDTMIKKGHKLDKQDQEKYKKIKDAINEWFYFKPIDFSSYSRTSLEDGLSVMTLFGLYVTPASDMLVDAYTIYAKKKRNEELTDEEKLWDNIMVGAHAIANFAGLQYPGMAMVHKLLKSEARKDGEKIKKEVNSKKDLEKAIKTMTGSRYQRRPTKAEKEESEIQDIIPEGLQKYE